MKRVGNLIERIADYDNLHLAFIKACRGKQGKAEVAKFRAQFDLNIRRLRESILTESADIGNYNYFEIHDPKTRIICAASFPERVLHHAVMNVCHDIFDRSLIYDTYATRKGKGVYAALDKAMKCMSNYKYVVKLDYRKYFDSIDHEILKQKVGRLFKDRALLNLLTQIIDSYNVKEGKGVPIGNLTSQYFANHYLSSLDHRMKEIVRVPIYIRYMDDVLMMDNDRVRLKGAVKDLIYYSATNLKLALKSPVYRVAASGVPFLGYVVHPNYLTLNGRSKIRFRRKLTSATALYEKGFYSEQEYQQRLLPLLAFVKHAKCRGLRSACLA